MEYCIWIKQVLLGISAKLRKPTQGMIGDWPTWQNILCEDRNNNCVRTLPRRQIIWNGISLRSSSILYGLQRASHPRFPSRATLAWLLATPPNEELARRLEWNKRLANQSSTSSTIVNLSGLGNRSLSTYLRKGTGLSLPSNPWGRHSRSYHMYSYTSGLTCNCVCHHYTHWHLKDKRENSQGSNN